LDDLPTGVSPSEALKGARSEGPETLSISSGRSTPQRAEPPPRAAHEPAPGRRATRPRITRG